MSHESAEEIVRKAHEAVRRGDREAFVACWAEECEYRPALERDIEGDENVFRGHDGIRLWWQGMSEAWSDFSTEVLEIRDAGYDRVLVSVLLRARGRRSDATIETPFFQLVTIRDGRVVASRDFSDRKQALNAAGLRE
jgi:ketosteroid isomerase-like protein